MTADCLVQKLSISTTGLIVDNPTKTGRIYHPPCFNCEVILILCNHQLENNKEEKGADVSYINFYAITNGRRGADPAAGDVSYINFYAITN